MRTLLVYFLAVLSVSVGSDRRLSAADGILGAQDADAEEFLAEFAAARDTLPRQFAAVGRRSMSSLKEEGFRESEISFIEAENANSQGKNARFSAFSLSRVRQTLEIREGRWDQTLVVNGKRHRRRGIPVKRYAVKASEGEDTPLEESKTRRMTPTFDPFYLSVGDSGSFLSSRINASFGLKILRDAEIQSAKIAKSGLLETVWYLGDNDSTVLDIAFDPKQGNRPVNVVWGKRRVNDDGHLSTDRRVVTVVRSRWHEVKFPSGAIWCPVEIQRLHNGSVTDQVEYNFRIEWRHLDDAKFPQPEEEGWRAYFASEFSVDWLSPIGDFKPHQLEYPGI